MDEIVDIEKRLVNLYNAISDTQVETMAEIPEPAFNFLKHFSYIELIKPFACEDLMKGKSCLFLQNKYKITAHQARRIGRDLGRYAKRPQ